MLISRRNLLLTASAGSFLAVAPGVKVALSADAAPARDILVVVFMRGGADGLQMVAPASDPNYISARPTIGLKATGTSAALPLGAAGSTNFFLNPQAPELKALYDGKKLAFVHAAGLLTANRSHFDCMDRMERGVIDGDASLNTGWLARHVNSLGAGRPVLGTISSAASNPTALLGHAQAVAVPNAESFNLLGGSLVVDYLRRSNAGTSPFQKNALATVEAVETVRTRLAAGTVDNGSTFGYTAGSLSQGLKSLGRLIKMNVGVDVAAVDMGGWDHHDNLPIEYTRRMQEFSRSLNAFWKDMAAYQSRLTIVTMTEFGRRVRENSSGGTDHGSGSLMTVLGGKVNGGKVYGSWPGLGATQLDTGDLKVTTDFRQVLAELLVKRHAQANLASVFPNLTYKPLGVVI